MFFAAMLIVDFYLWSVFSAKLQTFTKPLLMCNCCVHFVIFCRWVNYGSCIMGHGSVFGWVSGSWVTACDPLSALSGGALTMASAECEPIMGSGSGAPSGIQGQSLWSGGQGAKFPEAESFLTIKHPEGANGPHVRVLNDRNCILLLDSNETGGLIVMNVIWSHFLIGTPQKTAP